MLNKRIHGEISSFLLNNFVIYYHKLDVVHKPDSSDNVLEDFTLLANCLGLNKGNSLRGTYR